MEREALDSKLEHVLEHGMRLHLVREWLLDVPVEEAAAMLARVVSRGPQVDTAFDLLREAVVELLTLGGDGDEKDGADGAVPRASIPYSLRSEIYSEVARAGADGLMRLMRSSPAHVESLRVQRRLPREVAQIPLGRRRSLAKGDDTLLLEQLALDPDPLVISNLLRNPRLREPDVVRIAALRPVATSTLEAVAGSPRWSHQPRVRVALARNPHCPVEVAVRMLGGIPLSDLRAMSRDPDLHAETLAGIRVELERRESS